MDTNMWVENTPIEETSLAELEELCREAFSIKKNVESVEEQVSGMKDLLKEQVSKIERILVHFGKDNYKSAFGKVEIHQKLSVQTPKTDDDKQALFNWLTEKGIFLQYCTVNSQALNALYKAEREAAQIAGTECVVPGIGAPKMYNTTHLKKG